MIPTILSLFRLPSTPELWIKIDDSVGYYYDLGFLGLASLGLMPFKIKVCFQFYPQFFPELKPAFQVDSYTFLESITDVSLELNMSKKCETVDAIKNKNLDWKSNVDKTRLTFSTRPIVDNFFENYFRNYISKFQDTNKVLDDYMLFQKNYLEHAQQQFEGLQQRNAKWLEQLAHLGY